MTGHILVASAICRADDVFFCLEWFNGKISPESHRFFMVKNHGKTGVDFPKKTNPMIDSIYSMIFYDISNVSATKKGMVILWE